MTTLLPAIRSEVTKILTLRSLMVYSTVLLLLCAGIQAVSLSLFVDAVAGIDPEGMIEIFEGSPAPAVPEMTEQLVAAMFTPVPLLPVTGALIAGSEFWTGQIGASVVATPSRVRLILAKTIATALFTVAVCVAFALVTTAVMFPAVQDWRPEILVSPAVLGGYLRVTLVAVCTTTIALGITMLTRRAITGTLVMALLLGVTITQVVAAISATIDAVLPLSAARNLLFHDARDITPPVTSGPWTAAFVLSAWALAAVAASVVMTERRDAR